MSKWVYFRLYAYWVRIKFVKYFDCVNITLIFAPAKQQTVNVKQIKQYSYGY